MNITTFPKDKHFRFFEAAHTAALLSPGTSGGKKHNTFRLGAALVAKKILLTAKYNSYKTHPSLLAFSPYPFLHAESNAILSYGLDNCYGASLYVVRVRRNRDIALSRPCQACMKLIGSVGIKNIFYSTERGYERI